MCVCWLRLWRSSSLRRTAVVRPCVRRWQRKRRVCCSYALLWRRLVVDHNAYSALCLCVFTAHRRIKVCMCLYFSFQCRTRSWWNTIWHCKSVFRVRSHRVAVDCSPWEPGSPRGCMERWPPVCVTSAPSATSSPNGLRATTQTSPCCSALHVSAPSAVFML